MKLFKSFAMLFLAGLSLTACSDKNEEVIVENPDTPFVSQGEGFLAFTIQLPSTSGNSTRTNDDFNDGTADEYNVATGKLVLFTGDKEATATFAGAYALDIQPTTFKKASGGQLTSEAQIVQKIDKSKITGTNLYGYVILNDNSTLTIATDNSKVELSGVGFPDETRQTFAQFSQYTIGIIHATTPTNFLMTNAPMSNKKGGDSAPADGTTVTTLAVLDKDNIFPSAEEAQQNPAGHIDVERAAVKIEVMAGTGVSGKKKLEGEGDGTVTYNANGVLWGVGNENSIYYNTRQWDQAWNGLFASDTNEGTPRADSKYRFINKDAVSTTPSCTNFRTYWAKDVNYNNSTVKLHNTTGVEPDLALSTNTNPSVKYTMENTFDVPNMIFNNTTYVSLKAQFNDGEDFYTSNTLPTNKILLKVGSDKTNYLKVDEYVKEYIQAMTEFNTWKTQNANNKIENVIITVTDDGAKAIVGLSVKDGATDITGTINVTTLNNNLQLQRYENGWCYYAVRIRHFGADATEAADGKESGCETPWNRNNHSVNTVNGIYGWDAENTTKQEAANNNFLGRYGVVRNNWYKLEFDGIRRIGKPTPIVPTDDPDDTDDQVENYISLKIHILPWAVRTQKFIL